MNDPALTVRPKEKKSDLFAEWIGDKVGTIEFFVFCIILVTIPLLIPKLMNVVLYISSSYLQLILLPLIMIGQKQQDIRNAKRAQKDLETDLAAKKEVEDLRKQLEEVEKRLPEAIKQA